MNPPVLSDSHGKCMCSETAWRNQRRFKIADTEVAPGPESPPDQLAPDAGVVQDAAVGAAAEPAPVAVAPDSATVEAPEAATAPKKHHFLIPMPSRRSSKADKQATSEKTEETVQEAPARRESKGSILRGRRDRSRASSKRSRRTQDVANAEKSQETTTPTTPTTPETNGPSKPQQKKSSKILAFLSCCASGDVDGDDAPLPAKKTEKRQPVSNRLPTPDKIDAPTGDSSTAESRDPAYIENEKAGLAASADQAQLQEEERSPRAPADAQGEGTSVGAQPEVPSVDTKEHDDHVASVGAAVAANGTIPETTDVSQRHEGSTTLAVETPEIEATPKKATNGDNDELLHEEEVQLANKLPPPPPPPVPEAPTALEEQQWLLPAPLPPLKGRKCLVLDLDETLVHSSFKVKSLTLTVNKCLSANHSFLTAGLGTR